MNRGSPSATFWIVGSYPTVNETYKRKAFYGAHAEELDLMLDEAGIDSDDCYFTYAAQGRPKGNDYKNWLCTKTQFDKRGFIPYGDKYIDPRLANDFKRLARELHKHATESTVIIALGPVALLALTGHAAITDWRGSQLLYNAGRDLPIPVIPTYDPVTILKVWEWRYIALQDLRRASKGAAFQRDVEPESFIIRPTFDIAKRKLEEIYEEIDFAKQFETDCERFSRSKKISISRSRGNALNVANSGKSNKGGYSSKSVHLGVDIETRYGHISCIAIATSPIEAICIPFMVHGCNAGYWSQAEETTLVRIILNILQHPAVLNCGQNYTYDTQYMARHWGLILNRDNVFDTMTYWHVAYPGLQKSLAFISSMLLPHYVYWKDEGKGHAPKPESEDQYWTYNCKDAARTLELVPHLENIIHSQGLEIQVKEQSDLYRPALRMMLRGVGQQTAIKSDFAAQLMNAMHEREVWFEALTEAVVGDNKLVKSKKASPWYRSPTQLVKILYTIFKLPVQRGGVRKAPTSDDNALKVLMEVEPLLKPLFLKILEYRSLGVFLSTFVLATLDHDKKIRSSYGIGMAETFRFTSSKDCFGFGANLQNIPSGNIED